MPLFSKLINKLKSPGYTGQQIMPGVMGELLAKMGLTEIGPNRYDHHIFVETYRKSKKMYVHDTPYGPAAVPMKVAKQRLKDRERAARGRYVGPFPTHGAA